MRELECRHENQICGKHLTDIADLRNLEPYYRPEFKTADIAGAIVNEKVDDDGYLDFSEVWISTKSQPEHYFRVR